MKTANVDIAKSRRMATAQRRVNESNDRLASQIQSSLSGLGEPPQLGSHVTLADIQRSIRMSQIGEPYFEWALYRDMINNDSHMQAEIGKRIMSFMGQEERIEPEDKNNKDDIIASEVIEDMIAQCDNWNKGSTHLAQGHIWPVSGCEKIFGFDAGPRSKFRHPVNCYLKKLHPIPWPLFTYKVAYWNVNTSKGGPGDGFVPAGIFTSSGAIPINQVVGKTAYDNNQAIQQNANEVLIWNPNDWHPDLRFYNTYANGLIDWTMATCYKPDPTIHVLHSANVATCGFRENWEGVLRTLIPIWFYKKNLLDWYVRGMERYGAPFAVAQANVNNKNTQDLLIKAFNQAMKINALLVPHGTKIDLKEIMVSGMSDGFAKAIDVCNTEETKAILGQTLSTTSKGSGMMGGSGVADLHGEVRSEWAQFDKRSFGTMQWKQIFQQFLEYNGYKGRCKAVRGGMTPANLAIFSKAAQQLAQAGVVFDESAEQDLTAATGFKMKIVDPTKMAMAGKGKSGDKD